MTEIQFLQDTPISCGPLSLTWLSTATGNLMAIPYACVRAPEGQVLAVAMTALAGLLSLPAWVELSAHLFGGECDDKALHAVSELLGLGGYKGNWIRAEPPFEDGLLRIEPLVPN